MTGDLRARLREAFAWLGDRTDEHRYADLTAWWRDAGLLRDIGVALADLARDRDPTVVIGLEARGFILGSLVAANLGIGFVEVDTGGHALGARRIVDDSGATWVGATVIVDALDNHAIRRDLDLDSLLHQRELP